MADNGSGCHYRTLEVSKEASIDEIKAAFRRLSKETHPDVAKNADPERFKRINAAASVLTDPRQRRAYDMESRDLAGRFGRGVHHDSSFSNQDLYQKFGRGYRQQRPSTNMQVFLTTMFRPRNLVIGSIAVYTVAKLSAMFSQQDEDFASSQRVHAWKNEETGRWESPAPWDPKYQKLKPKLELVPRELVQSRGR